MTLVIHWSSAWLLSIELPSIWLADTIVLAELIVVLDSGGVILCLLLVALIEVGFKSELGLMVMKWSAILIIAFSFLSKGSAKIKSQSERAATQNDAISSCCPIVNLVLT